MHDVRALARESQRSALFVVRSFVVRSFVREWRGDEREVERDERRAIVIARETLERGEIVVGL